MRPTPADIDFLHPTAVLFDALRDADATQFQQGRLHVFRAFIAAQLCGQPIHVEQVPTAAFGRCCREERFGQHTTQ